MRTVGAPRWRLIADTILRDVEAARFVDRLPPESDLALRFKVNRHTIRQALTYLRDLGILGRRAGAGTHVHRDLVVIPVTRDISFSQLCTSGEKRVEVLSMRTEDASSEFAALVAGSFAAEQPLHIARVREWVEDLPLAITDHIFTAGFRAAFEAYGSLSSVRRAFAATCDQPLKRVSTTLASRPAALEEARLLDVEIGHQLLISIGVNRCGPTVAEISLSRLKAERVVFTFDNEEPQGASIAYRAD